MPTVTNLAFGEALRRAREAKRLSVEFVADQTGRTSDSVIRWEQGRTTPSSGTVLRLERLYECNLRDA